MTKHEDQIEFYTCPICGEGTGNDVDGSEEHECPEEKQYHKTMTSLTDKISELEMIAINGREALPDELVVNLSQAEEIFGRLAKAEEAVVGDWEVEQKRFIEMWNKGEFEWNHHDGDEIGKKPVSVYRVFDTYIKPLLAVKEREIEQAEQDGYKKGVEAVELPEYDHSKCPMRASCIGYQNAESDLENVKDEILFALDTPVPDKE